MSDLEFEGKALLDQHEASWIARGYRVVRRPSRADLPKFLRNHLPDAVLLGRTPSIAVEILRKGQSEKGRKVRDLSALLAKHDDWRLEVLYAGSEPDPLPEVPVEQVREVLASARRLETDERRGALLLLWAALEALARRLEPGKTRRPQAPGSVVELFAGAGYVAPSEAEQLRGAVRLRNRLIHGDLTATPSKLQIQAMASLVEDLIGVLERRTASQV